jgi:hypothetical protein
MGEVLTKTEFARRGGVEPAAESMWIARQHLTPPALLDDGRIDVDLAVEQLRDRLDHGRAAVNPDRFLAPDDVDAAGASRFSALNERQKLQRIEENDLRLRRLRREELEQAGSLIDVEAAGKVVGRALSELWTDIDRWGLDNFGAEAWRPAFRAFRQRRSDADERLAVGLPELLKVGDV